jgi:acyl carrier protein
MDIDLPAALMIGSTTISELRSQFSDAEASESSSQSEEDDDDEDDDESDGGTATPPSPSTPLTPASPSDLVDEFVAAVAGETGIEPQQIDDDTPFTDLGVDSLMSISIIGTLKERTGIELPATLLTDCTTMAEAKNTLRSKYGAGPVQGAGPVAAAVK